VRRLAWGAIALVLLVVAFVAGASVYVRSARPPVDGEIAVADLTRPVEVLRDSMGVPHVWADDETDLLFAQGYTHAQDRLWQMELFARVAQGRLAEVLGAPLVETDRFLRTIGIWRAAAAQEATLDAVTLNGLRAYAAGVNAWLRDHDGALPPEFLALRFAPDEWTPRLSLAIEKVMAWDLAAYDNGVQLARSVRAVGPERADLLMDAAAPGGATILEDGAVPPPVPATAALLLDASSITRASNAWVIGGALTRSGRPLLANDMHLALRAPSLWYLMALHAPGYEVAGMTLPGVPYVVAGHSRAVAWGFTNAMLDDVDLFIERADPADSSRYLTPDGSAPFEIRTDTIVVRGRDEPVVFRIRSTRHGPLLDAVAPDSGGGGVALRWAAHDPSNSLTAIPAMGRARDAAGFVAAVAGFDNPHQNVVYADTAGGFGYAMPGQRERTRGVRLPRARVLPR
jgi:penicillin amidase